MSRYIDADKLIEEIKERIKAAIEWGKSAETEEIKIRAEQSIATFCEASLTAKKLSTADVRENVRGKWVNNIHDIPICNQCGYMTPYDMLLDDYEYGNFCPNCGAEMERG